MPKIYTDAVIGRRYRHVSGKVVRVRAVPLLAGTDEEYVVYQENDRNHTVRTQSRASFFAQVDSPIQAQEFVPV